MRNKLMRDHHGIPGEEVMEIAIDLGKRMSLYAVALHGEAPYDFVESVARAIGMTPVAEPAVWNYPTTCGAGGNGRTVVQPITESFIHLDTWPDHEGFYLFICSCRDFDPEGLLVLFTDLNLTVLQTASHTLKLRD